MEKDDREVITWITREPVGKVPNLSRSPTHPMARLKEEADKWRTIWNPDTVEPTADKIEEYLWWIPFGGFNYGDWTSSGPQLKGIVHKNNKSAAGIDGWKPCEWDLLPLGFFYAQNELWNTIVERGLSLPDAWTQINIVFIPKDDDEGSMRPISIAALAWRTCMASVAHNARPWMELWAHPDLYGGIPGRTPEDLHERRLQAIQESEEANEAISGGKVDLSKCFDRVCITQAIAILRRLGTPNCLLNIIRRFHGKLKIWLSARGATLEDSYTRVRGLLEGCPMSVMAFGAIMSCFMNTVKAREPDVEWGTFIDDRVAWARGNNTVQRVRNAMAVAYKFDTDHGFLWNLGKGCTFTNKYHLRRTLNRTMGTWVGEPKKTVRQPRNHLRCHAGGHPRWPNHHP